MQQKVREVIKLSKLWKIVKCIRRHCHLNRIIIWGRKGALGQNRTLKLCVIRDLSKNRSKDPILGIAVTRSIRSAPSSSNSHSSSIRAGSRCLTSNTASQNPTATSSNKERRRPPKDLRATISCFSHQASNKLAALAASWYCRWQRARSGNSRNLPTFSRQAATVDGIWVSKNRPSVRYPPLKRLNRRETHRQKALQRISTFLRGNGEWGL